MSSTTETIYTFCYDETADYTNKIVLKHTQTEEIYAEIYYTFSGTNEIRYNLLKDDIINNTTNRYTSLLTVLKNNCDLLKNNNLSVIESYFPEHTLEIQQIRDGDNR